MMAEHPLSQRIADVLGLQPDAPAMEYDRQWVSWGQLGDTGRADRALVGRRPTTRSESCCATGPATWRRFLGVLLCRRHRRRHQPGPRRRTHQGRHRRAWAAADHRRARRPGHAGRRGAGTTTVSISAIWRRADSVAAGRIARPRCRPGVAVRMLTSGTTGPPKRVDLTYDMLAHSVMGPSLTARRRPRSCGAVWRSSTRRWCISAGCSGCCNASPRPRPFVLLERFELNRWAEAVRAHRPRAVSLVPAALRMVLHSDLTRDDLASIRAVTSGTAPLSPDDADAFTEKYGIPVLTSYAATEFGGGVAGWTLADHQKYWQAKRGSVGRANPGAQLRVVGDDGTPLGPDQIGLLEVKPRQLGPSADWMRTTDMARIDADGFLWIVGRADQAIIRGGFKVMPDDVRSRAGSPSRGGGRRGGRATRRAPRGDAGRHGGTARARIGRRRRADRLSCERGWPATRFPPTSRSSTRSRERPPASRSQRGPAHSSATAARRATMPSDSPTVAEVLRAQARAARRPPAAGLRRRPHQLCRGRPPLGASWLAG